MISTCPQKVKKWNSTSQKFVRFSSNFFRSASGATSIEYSLIVAGIALLMILTVSLLGHSMGNTFQKAGDGMDGVVAQADTGRGWRIR